MKRNMLVAIVALGIFVTAFAFSGTSTQTEKKGSCEGEMKTCPVGHSCCQ